jgi:ferric iron reductase protein FhuF
MILALREAAALGPFFTMALPGEAASTVEWHPFRQLGEPTGVALLSDQISRLGAFLATDEERAVASILHLGTASAICAPLLATAALAATIPALPAEHLRFGFEGNGPIRLALSRLPPGTPPALLPALADGLIEVALDGLLSSFTEALTAAVAVPPNTLRGNVFSALAAAARLITPAAAGARARALVDLVARRYLPLQDAGTLDWRAVDAPDPQAYFRRRNCCLFYRVPGGGICGDCLLTP